MPLFFCEILGAKKSFLRRGGFLHVKEMTQTGRRFFLNE